MKKRIEFNLSEDKAAELDALVIMTGLGTRVKLIDAALTLFEWVVKEKLAGRIIASVSENPGHYKELVMPGLSIHNTEELIRQATELIENDNRAKKLAEAATHEESEEKVIMA